MIQDFGSRSRSRFKGLGFGGFLRLDEFEELQGVSGFMVQRSRVAWGLAAWGFFVKV